MRNGNIEGKGASDLRISNIFYASIACTQYEPIAGRQYTDLPKFLKNKRAIINVQNKNNRCFGYAVLSALHPPKKNPQNPIYYNKYFAEHGLDKLKYSVRPEDISSTSQAR